MRGSPATSRKRSKSQIQQVESSSSPISGGPHLQRRLIVVFLVVVAFVLVRVDVARAAVEAFVVLVVVILITGTALSRSDCEYRGARGAHGYAGGIRNTCPG